MARMVLQQEELETEAKCRAMAIFNHIPWGCATIGKGEKGVEQAASKPRKHPPYTKASMRERIGSVSRLFALAGPG